MQKMTKAGILPKSRATVRRRLAATAAWAAAVLGAAVLLAPASPAADQDPTPPDKPKAGDRIDGKRLIGATAIVVEKKSGISFAARVDTGAQGTSLHVEEWQIGGQREQEAQRANIGKQIRFRVRNNNGDDDWIQAIIVDTVLVKNAEKKERRYKVVVTLRIGDFEKECIVNINDRSKMTYPILIGRNFLHGDFLVDVAMDESVVVTAAETEVAPTGEKIEEEHVDEVEEPDTDNTDETEESEESEADDESQPSDSVDPAGELAD